MKKTSPTEHQIQENPESYDISQNMDNLSPIDWKKEIVVDDFSLMNISTHLDDILNQTVMTEKKRNEFIIEEERRSGQFGVESKMGEMTEELKDQIRIPVMKFKTMKTTELQKPKECQDRLKVLKVLLICAILAVVPFICNDQNLLTMNNLTQ